MIIDTNDPTIKAFGGGFVCGFGLGVCFMLGVITVTFQVLTSIPLYGTIMYEIN